MYYNTEDAQLNDEAKLETVLNNDTIRLKKGEDNISISGDGVLYNDDLEELLSINDILKQDIVNIVIDDGITEIGYNCFNGYNYVETIWISDTVESIHNGAMRNCDNLQYVRLPKNIKVGRDFLFNCNNVYIVTDGLSDELPVLYNIDSSHVLPEVDSYEAYVDKRSKAPYITIPPIKLFCNDPNTTDTTNDTMVIHSGYLQYGPYADIKSGKYHVEVEGNNFAQVNKEDVYVNVGGHIMITDIIITSTKISYNVSFNTDMHGVEFCIFNSGEKDIEIFSVNVFDEDIVIPGGVKKWW